MDGSWEADSSKANAGRAGLILTGGGARAAYQVGVLKALAEIHASPEWPFPIIVGTSAGAVSASILAGNVTRWHQSVVEIEKVWANFHVAQVFRSGRHGHAQGRRPLDGFAVHRRHDRPAEIAARQLAAARAACRSVTRFRRHPRQRGAAATCARWRCAPPAISPRARCRSSKPRPPSANGRARSGTANACRLSLDYLMAQPRHPVPVSADVPARRILRRRRDAPDRAAVSPAIHLGADRVLVLGVRPTHLDLIPRFVASDSPPTPGQLFGYMLDTLFSDQISADLENLNRINRLSAMAGGADRHAPDPHRC